jgi:hypothetical protein
VTALRSAAAALRAFLRGFTGLPAAPRAGCACEARRALEEGAARRGRCC